MVSQIVELAKLITEKSSPANQKILLNNLENNLKSILSHRSDLLSDLSGIAIDRAKNLAIIDEGADSGWVLYENRRGQWLALTTQVGSVGRAQSLIENDSSFVFYFLGIGFGEELSAWHEHTQQNNTKLHSLGYAPAIVLFETTTVYFLLFLLTGNRQTLLEDGRFYPFIGSNAFTRFCAFALNNAINMPMYRPCYSFALDRDSLSATLDNTLKLLDNQQAETSYTRVQELTTYYDAQFGSRLAKKIATKNYADIKIVGITSLYTSFLQYCTRDLIAGFEELGCQVNVITEPSHHYRSSKLFIFNSFYNTLPDIVIWLDGLRDDTIPAHLPAHFWIQDELQRLVSPTAPALTRYDFVDVLGSGWQSRFQNRPYYANHPVGVLPLGFHAGSYFPIEGTAKDIDVLYVSHLIDPELTLEPYRLGNVALFKTQQEGEWLNEGGDEQYLTQVWQRVAQALDKLTMDELLALFESETRRKDWLLAQIDAVLPEGLLDMLVEPAGMRGRIGNDILSQLKLRPMQILAKAGINIAVYGNNWDKYSDLALFARGAAKNGTELNRLHNRSKICINNSALISFHMRALEIMASGAFMLSRRIPLEYDIMPIGSLLQEDTQIAFFDEKNLVERVNYYLNQDNERQQMAEAALLSVQKNHTYKQRAEHILTDVMQRFI